MEKKKEGVKWSIGMRDGGHNGNTIYANDGTDRYTDTPICVLYGVSLHRALDEMGERDKDGLANGRLIAAAPEMYEALKRLERMFGHFPFVDELLKKIDKK